MKTNYYTPSPVDTSYVDLPQALDELTENMARNVHEIWAEGWSYGSQRDDNLKQHPCLIPYENLPESERDYDRNTTVKTLKLILSLGYRIEKG